MADGAAPKPYKPNPADLLSGSIAHTGNTTETAFLTIPAGRTWCGNVTVEGTYNNTTFIPHTVDVKTDGTGVLPADGTIIVRAQTHREIVTAVATVPEVYVVAPAGNSVTLTILLSTGTDLRGFAAAHGVLL